MPQHANNLSRNADACANRPPAFDLARSIEIHLRSTEKTHEKVVGRTTNGLIGLNDEVTWEATHLCIRQRLTSRITVWNLAVSF